MLGIFVITLNILNCISIIPFSSLTLRGVFDKLLLILFNVLYIVMESK